MYVVYCCDKITIALNKCWALSIRRYTKKGQSESCNKMIKQNKMRVSLVCRNVKIAKSSVVHFRVAKLCNKRVKPKIYATHFDFLLNQIMIYTRS